MTYHTQQHRNHVARDAWDAFIQQYPRVSRCLLLVRSVCGYFLNGHALVALVRWMVQVAGRVAESALLLATVYVTLNNVAHTLLSWIFPEQVLGILNYLSLVAFSVLPELMVTTAITLTVDHRILFLRHRHWRNLELVWAILYSVPTATFVVMTIYTLLGFVQIVSVSGTPAQATGTALTIRLLAGWSYAMIEMLYATLGTQGTPAFPDDLLTQPTPRQSQATPHTHEPTQAQRRRIRAAEAQAVTPQAFESAAQEIERLQAQVRAARARIERQAFAQAAPRASSPASSSLMGEALQTAQDDP